MNYFMTPMALNLSSSPTCYIQRQSPEMTPEDTILDLCVRKRPRTESPDYTLSYPSPRRTPDYPDPTPTTYYPKGTDSMSECSETNSRSSAMSPDSTPQTRPFKAFPKDPLAQQPQVQPSENVDQTTYEDFRRKMLAQIQASHSSSNKNMRRNQVQTGRNADPEYLERRKKNNEAAKRSRDARKAKEDEIAIRCAYLEQQNMNLKFKLAALNSEVEKMRSRVYR